MNAKSCQQSLKSKYYLLDEIPCMPKDSLYFLRTRTREFYLHRFKMYSIVKFHAGVERTLACAVSSICKGTPTESVWSSLPHSLIKHHTLTANRNDSVFVSPLVRGTASPPFPSQPLCTGFKSCFCPLTFWGGSG